MALLEQLPVTEHVAQWEVWGTTARVVVTDPAALAAARALVVSELQRVDAACNRFRADSELSRLRPGVETEVSRTLAELLAAALQAAERTGGDVDPTLGDAVSALGYDRDLAEFQTSGVPAVRVKVVTRDRPDWRGVRLRRRRVVVPHGVRLDLGATAKAAAADRCAALVARRLGVGVLVALGGDLATAGPAPGTGWTVLVQDGVDEPADLVTLPPGGALATSSTLSRRWRCGTRLVHHVLDPRTLLPADPVWRTVSVAAGSCLEANTASTAALVRGRAALPWLHGAGTTARLVSADGDVLLTGRWPGAGGAP
ncbi:FAD:protein FMN transferase [Kineococcus arenarius]|uniref:FAD:protein FMN transferase n=1 Tax=Kineococcus sp. SYSU DK007 TaxID=3383128 RepID=UPI003D7E8CE4